MYRHALPPGFVFKTKKKPDEDQEDEKISLEQLVEEEVCMCTILKLVSTEDCFVRERSC